MLLRSSNASSDLALLLGTRTLLGAPGIAARNKDATFIVARTDRT